MTKQASITGKEPWLAVILSSLFPGIGQIYAGHKIKGVILIISSLYLLFLTLTGSPRGQLVNMILLVAIFNLFDAHRCARKANHPDFERIRKSEKDPWLAVFLSRFLPGLGHAYLGKWGWASLFFILLIITSFLSIKYGLIGYLLGSIVLPISCVYHAYISAKTTRPKSPQLILRITLVLLLLQLAGSSVNFFEARYIPSGAMLPTLEINDRILINKGIYRFKKPQRGDIIVFNPTATLRQENFKDAFTKRVIGLPGDKVEIKKNGKVYINDRVLQEDYIKESPNYEYGPAVVPENSYFVLGDNRNDSYDSRYWGFVSEEDIIGKATKRFWPPERIGNL